MDEDTDPLEEEEEEDREEVVPDTGWAWVVCAGSFFVNFICDGVMFSFGVLLLGLLDYFGDTKAKTAWIGSTLLGMSMGAGPLVSILLERYSCRQVVIMGSIITTISFIIGIFSPNVEMLIIFYGVIGGTGIGLTYLTSIVVVGLYFNKRRALATGIAMSGSGFGTFTMAYMIDRLLDEYNWKGTVLILAGLSLNCVVCGAVFRPLAKREEDMQPNSPIVVNEEKVNTPKSNGFIVSNGQVPSKQELEMRTKDRLLNGLRVMNVESVTIPRIHNLTTEKSSVSPINGLSLDMNGINLKSVLTGVRLQGEAGNKSSSLGHLNKPDTTTYMKTSPHLRTYQSEQHLHHHKHSEVHKTKTIKDGYLHPLRRRDIYYTGSLYKLPEYKKSQDMQSFVELMTKAEDESLSDADIEDISGVIKQHNPHLNVKHSIKKHLLLFKDKMFLWILLTMVLWTGQSTALTYIPDLAVSKDIHRANAALLLSALGIANIIGRIMAGWLATLPSVDSMLIYGCALVFAAIATALLPWCSEFWMFVLLSSVFGLSMGSYVSLRTIVLADVLGIHKLTPSFGIVALLQGIMFTIGAPISGALLDATQSYFPAFYLISGLYLLSSVIAFVLYYKLKHRPPIIYEESWIKAGDVKHIKQYEMQPLNREENDNELKSK